MKRDKGKMKLYVCGPMTGRKDMNRAAFKAARELLRKAGFEVVCPVELNRGMEQGWCACMKRDVAAMMGCDGLAVLDGWTGSKGAKIEVALARELSMPQWGVWWWVKSKAKSGKQKAEMKSSGGLLRCARGAAKTGKT